MLRNGITPKVTFSVVVADSAEVVALVEQNRASFGFCLLGSMPRTLDARVLYREFFALYCGPGHRLFAKEGTSRWRTCAA